MRLILSALIVASGHVSAQANECQKVEYKCGCVEVPNGSNRRQYKESALVYIRLERETGKYQVVQELDRVTNECVGGLEDEWSCYRKAFEKCKLRERVIGPICN